MKHEFVARRFPRQRTADGRAYVHWGYAHAVRGAGGVFVEVGGPDGTTRQEFEAALGPNTAGVYWVSDGVEPGLQLAEVSQIAHAHGVPVLVDASNTLPPPEHWYAFVEMGADLVAFSGGKGLRGPQGSGILTGRADLIRAARLQSAPVQGIGRPMKVSKEEIVGLLTALEIWANLDHAVELRAARRRTDLVVAALDGLPGVRAEHRFPDHVGRPYPTAFVRVDPATGLAAADAIAGPASPAPASLTGAGTGLRAADVIARLLEGEPPIAVMGFADPQVVRVDVRILSDEEAAVVARRLREVLSPPRHHHRHLTCNNGRGPPPPGAAPHVEARAEARCLTFLS
jgi:L-seryl-tRNA(Ser) seleniumtransferase